MEGIWKELGGIFAWGIKSMLHPPWIGVSTEYLRHCRDVHGEDKYSVPGGSLVELSKSVLVPCQVNLLNQVRLPLPGYVNLPT